MQTRYAGFWIRALATIIDEVIIEGTSWLLELMGLGIWFWTRRLVFGAGAGSGADDGALSPLTEQFLGMAFSLALALPYYIVTHARYGATVGKWACGLRVVRARDFTMLSYGQAAGRFFACLVSYLPVGAGFLMAAFHPDKRALHDLIAGTAVIHWRGKLKRLEREQPLVSPPAAAPSAKARARSRGPARAAPTPRAASLPGPRKSGTRSEPYPGAVP